MNKKTTLSLALLLTLLFSLWAGNSASVRAQEEEISTVLARAAARGFLVSLTRPELTDTMEFYLLENVDQAVVQALRELSVTDYEITGGQWVSDVTYQVKATLQPGQQEIAVYSGKYDGRWQVEAIDLPTDQATTDADAEEEQAAAATATTRSASNLSGKLVFQTHSGSDIYLINADGTGLQRITHGIDPQLSPDAGQITFTRWEPRYELFTINIDGSGEQAWTHGWNKMKSPTWTADGSTLIFSYQEGGRLEPEEGHININQAIRDGDDIEIPPEAVGIEEEHGIIEFTIPADAWWHLMQIELSGRQFNGLMTELHSYGPTGHPTNPNLVLYKSNTGIALHNIATGIDQAITTDAKDHTPVLSPDGTQLVTSYWQNDHWEVHRLNIDGSHRRRLTATPITVLADKTELAQEPVEGQMRYVASVNPSWNNAAPTWSPDGRQIAFVTDRTGQWEIWLMNADGSNQRPMFPAGTLDGITLQYDGVDERMLSWR